MCGCAGEYKCWGHFVESLSHADISHAEKVKAFYAQERPSVYADSEDTVVCDVCDKEIHRSIARIITGIGWMCPEGNKCEGPGLKGLLTTPTVFDSVETDWAPFFDHEPLRREPLVKEADPELERLLAEEEEINAQAEFLARPGRVSTMGELRAMTAAFSDGCYLDETIVVEPVINAGRWKVAFKRIGDPK